MTVSRLVSFGHLAHPLFVGSFLQFAVDNAGALAHLLVQHIVIVTQAIVLAVPIGVLLGVAITFEDRIATVVLWLAGIMMTIPSIALFGLLIPYFGIGKPPVVVALILYSQLPVVRNTYIGLTQVDEAAISAGRGIGMTRLQRLWRIRVPKALPVIMAGVRMAVVMNIAVATIAVYIGAGGLGTIINEGITGTNSVKLIVGAVAVSLLAIIADYLFLFIQKLLTPKGLRGATS